MQLAEYAHYDAVGLAALVATKQVTPSELAQTAAAAIAAINPLVNAVVETYPDRIDHLDEQRLGNGPFRGVPFLMKDVFGHEAGRTIEFGTTGGVARSSLNHRLQARKPPAFEKIAHCPGRLKPALPGGVAIRIPILTTMPSWEFTITGCGTSHGNPMWGMPQWWSEDPRDRRRRSGGMLRGPEGQVLLLDCGPDLAYQMTDPYRDWDGRSYPARSITRCDGVLLTHDHADHCHGINDLRHLDRLMYYAGQRLENGIPIFGHREHLDAVRLMFPYCFGAEPDTYTLSKPALRLSELNDAQPTQIAGMTVTMVAMDHGPAGRTSGFRCGDMAYLTDLKTLPASAEASLQGLDLLAISMLRTDPHPTHQSWDEAQAVIARLKPQRTVLVHMGPEVRYAEWAPRMPRGITMAIDGWTTTVSTP